MADLRVAVQTKVIEACLAGTFLIVKYDDDTHYPIEPTETVVPSSVTCNELNAGISGDKARNSRGAGYVLSDWRFECFMEFTKEVSLTTFLTTELETIRFTTEEGLRATISFGEYTVEHPVRQGAHNGTKAIIGLTVQTRR